MWELIKLSWDVFVLRDASRKGQLTWRVWLSAIAFVLAIYGIGLPAVLLYEKHPEDKPIFIASMVLVGLITVSFFYISIRRWLRMRADGSDNPKSGSAS
jgi:Na+/melibiose symporter-like transporter